MAKSTQKHERSKYLTLWPPWTSTATTANHTKVRYTFADYTQIEMRTIALWREGNSRPGRLRGFGSNRLDDYGRGKIGNRRNRR